MSDQDETRRTILFIVVALLFGSFVLGIGRTNGHGSMRTEDVILLG
ncbi:hypothetical protein [Bacillus sp. FJAT-45037]|nr:hypothetical protein [Bacillus sp. FJAT-45037]